MLHQQTKNTVLALGQALVLALPLACVLAVSSAALAGPAAAGVHPPPRAATASMSPAPGGDALDPGGTPPGPGDLIQAGAQEDNIYRPVRLDVRHIVWFEPGQRGLVEAHPLVMGLAAMALATVTLLFFFLRGIKRPRDGDI